MNFSPRSPLGVRGNDSKLSATEQTPPDFSQRSPLGVRGNDSELPAASVAEVPSQGSAAKSHETTRGPSSDPIRKLAKVLTPFLKKGPDVFPKVCIQQKSI